MLVSVVQGMYQAAFSVFLSVADLSHFSVIAVGICSIGLSLFLVKNMAGMLQGEDWMSGRSVHTVHQSVPQMKMIKVHIPFAFKIEESSSSDTRKVECCVSSETRYRFQAFWGVPIRELHGFLSSSWSSQGSLSIGCQAQGMVYEDEAHEEKTIELTVPEANIDLGCPPRHSYPLVVFIVRDQPDPAVPDDTHALVNIVHVKDPVFTLPSTILAQYLKMSNGQLSCLKQLYLASGDLSYDSRMGVEQLCVICQYFPLSRALLPCRHTCVCASCFGKLECCPLCRSRISSYFCIRSEDYLQDCKPPTPPEPFHQWIQGKLNQLLGFPR